MTAKKKVSYKVTITTWFWMSKLRTELNEWGIKQSQYTINGNLLFTQDKNVLDVVTETFGKALAFVYSIEETN